MHQPAVSRASIRALDLQLRGHVRRSRLLSRIISARTCALQLTTEPEDPNHISASQQLLRSASRCITFRFPSQHSLKDVNPISQALCYGTDGVSISVKGLARD